QPQNHWERQYIKLKIIKWVALLAAVVALLHRGGVAGSLDPNDYHTRPPLDFWGFSDTNWLSHSGHGPVSFTNLMNVPYLGDGNALLLDSTNAAWLQYNITEGGTNRLTVDQGSIMLWFASSWSGTNQGGAGPGDWSRIIE